MAVSSVLTGCKSVNYFAKPDIAEPGQLRINKSEFIRTGNDKIKFRKYVLINTNKFNYPICLFRISDTEFSAVLLQCTHKGCELNPQGDYLVCPCHGSEFSNLGIVVQPPAEENLKTFNVKTDNDHVFIQL